MQVALTQLPYNCLLEALNNRALLPERLWGGMSSEQQAMLVQWRNMTLEPLLETAGELALIALLHLCMSKPLPAVSSPYKLHPLIDVPIYLAQMLR